MRHWGPPTAKKESLLARLLLWATLFLTAEKLMSSHTWLAPCLLPIGFYQFYRLPKKIDDVTRQSSRTEFLSLKIHKNFDWLEKSEKAEFTETVSIFCLIEAEPTRKSTTTPTIARFWTPTVEKKLTQPAKKGVIRTKGFIGEAIYM